MDTNLVLAIVGIVALALFTTLAFVLLSRKRRLHLKERFGPEYDRLVAEEGRKAEARLLDREKRVAKLDIRSLPAELREKFARSWKSVQSHFVDEPGAAVSEADELVRKVMEERGYPVTTFDQASADLSVDHPVVVQEYRTAHEIALKRARGQASTEDLRQAFIHYRALFEELLEGPGLMKA